MKPKAKKFLSNFFFGLFSNDHALEGAKSNPWWVCLIIALFAVIIPVIPITVMQSRTYGASFLANYTYRFDQNIADLTVKMAKEKKEFVVEADKTLSYQIDGAKQSRDVTVDTEILAYHQNAANGQYELVLYYTVRDNSAVKTYIDNIAKLSYKSGTIEAPEEDYDGTSYAPSFIVLSKGGIYTRLNKDDSTAIGSNTYTAYVTDWKYFESETKLITGALPEGKSADEVNLNKEEDVTSIFKNWKEYYNKAYISQKKYNTWMTSLLFLGIYTALVFIMGVLIFILTRGKNNMFNYLKFIDTQKIVWWASLSPAILAMIVGFIFSNFAQMMFIVLLGMRVMWISMKQLRPQY